MDNAAVAVRDKRIADLTELVSEQQSVSSHRPYGKVLRALRLILAMQESNAALQRQVEEFRRYVWASVPGKPKGMPGNKRGL